MILGLIRSVVARVQRTRELNRYTRWTIGDLFRQQGAQIGQGCSFLIKSLGHEPYLIKIGNRVTVAGGVTFLTHDGGPWLFRQEIPDIQVYGPIIIEDNCVIGQNAVIFPNVRIGPNAIVGAGSVVISDVPEGRIVMGIPARVFGSVDKYKEKCVERWSKQRPPDAVVEPGRTWWTSRNFDANRERLRKHLTKLFWQDGYRETQE